jgi:hypothetical protein
MHAMIFAHLRGRVPIGRGPLVETAARRSGLSYARRVLPLTLLAATLLTPGTVRSQEGIAPAIWPDRSAPLGNASQIFGWNFGSQQSLDLVVIRPDGKILKGDGLESCPGGAPSCWDTVAADADGGVLQDPYTYLVGSVFGLYEVRAYASPWSGSLAEPPIAATSFFYSDRFAR